MSLGRRLLDLLIRVQQSLPFMLPNEYVAWRSYNRRFSKTCDGCNSEKGVYKITYQDSQIPRTLVYPYPVRLCTDCLCEADEKVGIIDDGDSGAGETFRVERR